MSQRQRIVISQQQRLALNGSLHASIRLLRSDTAGLTRYLEEQAAENPHLRLIAPEPPKLGDWLPRWSGVLAFGPRGALVTQDAAAAAPGLIAYVTAAIQALSLPRLALRIALALVEALEPSGWLGRTTAQIADDLGLPLEEVDAVLTRLQRIEPAGLFARNLADCLALQALDQKRLDPPMAMILRHLDLLAAGDTARLARLCGCDEAGVLARFRLIRTMNPKPGNDFLPDNPVLTREPDLVARPLKDGRWQIALNRSALPGLEVIVDAAKRDAKAYAEAKALHYMLAARNDTLLRVGREIVSRQVAALISGPAALQPMRMAEVAEALGMHISTISRVVAGASLDSPRGLWMLRAMFSGARGSGAKGNGVGGSRSGGGGTGGGGTGRLPGANAASATDDDGPKMAAAALRHRLGQIVASEPALAPYSDAVLTERLAEETGVLLARRTVALYRDTLGIPPAHRRKLRRSGGPIG